MKLIIGASIARAQRDLKLILCHDIWNGSHAHIIVVTKDSQQCKNFYSEVQKKITDALKRLLGLRHLEIWEGYPMVARIADLEKAKERIAYLYANPAQDDLVNSIDEFPGFSSWKGYLSGLNSLGARSVEIYPWIRLNQIPKIASPMLDVATDLNLVRLIKKRSKNKHELVRMPNEWMKCFGITSENEVAKINQEIVQAVKNRELLALGYREKNRKSILGTRALQRQPILKAHEPKKYGRKIYILCSIKKLRINLIREFRAFCAQCRDCYQSWLTGNTAVLWPPGAFQPPLPPRVNLLPD